MPVKTVKVRKRHKPRFTEEDLRLHLKKVTLPFVMYLINHLPLIREYRGPIEINAVLPYEKKIQAYLTMHANRNEENKIFGVVIVVGKWPDAHGDRICIYLSGEGPIFEALGTNAVEKEFAHYRIKTRVLKKICHAVSGLKAPHSKERRHFHPHTRTATGRATMREELSSDHGAHSPVPTEPDQQYFYLGRKGNELTFLTATAADVQRICHRKV